MRRALLPAALLALACAGPAAASLPAASRLAARTVSLEERPTMVLAQRTIDREWGLSQDSTYKTVDVPGWRSEGGALGLSLVLPGAGQLYSGEGSGVWYALAEVVGWTGRWYLRHRADQLRDDQAGFAGNPNDSLSAWSFRRWEKLNNASADELRALWTGDRAAFYYLIGNDSRYLNGWYGTPRITRNQFNGYMDTADLERRRSRWVEAGLWINHVVSAVDALQAARLHNLPLRQRLDLRLGGGWHGGRPGLTVELQRTF